MLPNRSKSLFKFYNKERKLLHVSKNPNFQMLPSKEWWPDVDHVLVKHFDSLDELEIAKYDALSKMEQAANVTIDAKVQNRQFDVVLGGDGE